MILLAEISRRRGAHASPQGPTTRTNTVRLCATLPLVGCEVTVKENTRDIGYVAKAQLLKKGSFPSPFYDRCIVYITNPLFLYSALVPRMLPSTRSSPMRTAAPAPRVYAPFARSAPGSRTPAIASQLTEGDKKSQTLSYPCGPLRRA